MYTFYAFFWAMFTGSLFILFLHFLMKDTSILLKTGLGFFILGTALCILRLFTPLEIPFHQYRIEYPRFISELIRPRDFFDTGIPLIYVIVFCSLMVSFILFLHFIFKVIHRKQRDPHFIACNDQPVTAFQVKLIPC